MSTTQQCTAILVPAATAARLANARMPTIIRCGIDRVGQNDPPYGKKFTLTGNVVRLRNPETGRWYRDFWPWMG